MISFKRAVTFTTSQALKAFLQTFLLTLNLPVILLDRISFTRKSRRVHFSVDNFVDHNVAGEAAVKESIDFAQIWVDICFSYVVINESVWQEEI